MKARHGIGIAGATALLGALALAPGTASAAPDAVIQPTTCAIQFFPPPQVDDFVIHSTGWAFCNTFVSPIEGRMELLLDGTTVRSVDFYQNDVLGVGAQVQMSCVSGGYQARMSAHWVDPSGRESSASEETPVTDITC